MDSSQAVKPSSVRLCLFGDLEIARGEDKIRLPTRKAEHLLAYLALFPKAHDREHLAALFWGDVPDEQARGSLRKALTALRAACGADVVVADRLTVRLNPDYPLWIDAAEFERRVAPRPPADALPNAEQLATLDLYRGDLLPDFYDDWITPLREHYRAAFLERALALAATLRARSEYTHAVALAQRALAADRANERAHQHLMFCYLALGRRSEALQQYEICKRALWEELAVAPSRETTALYRWIGQDTQARPAAEALLTNLPIPFSSFVGREEETAAIKRLLGAGGDVASGPPIRLLTLTGPGGSGKTRLAIQAATDLLDAFPDGVWWVELAALSDGALAPQAVAKALGVRESPGEPLTDLLVAFLRPRRPLLVLDNCEHLVTACAVLAGTLLGHCPHLAILATSRQALGLPGEHTLPVPTLPVPRYGRWALVESLLNFEGVRLFVERATAVNPHFALTETNAPAVMQICARLDGIPLALELAAMWVKTLSVEEVAARLDDRFNLLMLGSRAAPPRHQTLRGVLDWSYNLLTAPEQAMLRRLAVFAGGWSAAAAEAVAAGAGDPAALPLLARLVDQSLVVAQPEPGPARFDMLETIRHYARERLRAAGEAAVVHGRHLDYTLRLAEAAERGLRGPAQGDWLARLDLELDNVRAALEWAADNDISRGLRLAGALLWYWNLRGHWQEGPAWLSRLLTVGSPASAPARAKALVAAASLAFWGSNDYAAAREWLTEAVALTRAASPADPWSLGDALALYGATLVEAGEAVAARSALDEALAIGEALGDDGRWVRAWAMMALGDLAGDPTQKRADYETSAALFRAMGDRAQLPVVLARLAWFHMGQRDLAAAEACAHESYALTEAIGDVMGAAWMLKLRGDLALSRADYTLAARHYQDALERFRALGSQDGIADALGGLAAARSAQNHTSI